VLNTRFRHRPIEYGETLILSISGLPRHAFKEYFNPSLID